MKVEILVHLFHAHHTLSQSHFVLSWNKSLHGLDPIFFVIPHDCIYIFSNKVLAYIWNMHGPQMFFVKTK